MLAGVAPLAGVTVSQDELVTEVVNGSAAPLLPTFTICEGGAGSPMR